MLSINEVGTLVRHASNVVSHPVGFKRLSWELPFRAIDPGMGVIPRCERLETKPSFAAPGVEENGHAGMDSFELSLGRFRHDRRCQQPFGFWPRRVFPPRHEAGCIQEWGVRIVEVVRDFPVRSRLPLVVAVHGDECAIAPKGAAKTWLFYESFSPRVKGFRGEREVFCEPGDEAPMGRYAQLS